LTLSLRLVAYHRFLRTLLIGSAAFLFLRGFLVFLEVVYQARSYLGTFSSGTFLPSVKCSAKFMSSLYSLIAFPFLSSHGHLFPPTSFLCNSLSPPFLFSALIDPPKEAFAVVAHSSLSPFVFSWFFIGFLSQFFSLVFSLIMEFVACRSPTKTFLASASPLFRFLLLDLHAPFFFFPSSSLCHSSSGRDAYSTSSLILLRLHTLC